jgi:hypothetical protein
MTWRVSTREKKNVVEVELWEKDGLVARREHGWRWGRFDYDEKPEVIGLDWETNENGVDAFFLGDIQDHSMDDGCWQEWTWPEEMDPEECERLEEIYNEEFDEGLENEGWSSTDTEYWLHGPLDLEFIPDNVDHN